MIPPDPQAEAQQRLAQLEHDYQEAQVRSVALAGRLLKVQDELSRLNLWGRPGDSAYTLGACESCYGALPFTENDWFLTCSCAYRTLHPLRRGELPAKRWSLVFYRTAETSENWGWSLQYLAHFHETPPEGSVRLKLWSAKHGWLFLHGASRRRDEPDHPNRDRTLTWRGPITEDERAVALAAKRAFVEPWYGAY